MANTIKLKRGSGSDPQASDLEVGELAIRTDSGKIFTKKDNGSVAEISGGGGIDDGDKGDITVANGGDTFTIDSGVIDNANIASNAAIAGTKISPNFGSQAITGTTGTFTGGTLTLGTADSSSAHINSFELMTFNIDTDNDDTNRYFAFYKNGASGSGTELFKIDESGNVTVAGTVDGRDLATDGSKLDGIESGATADQTASEILTLIKTVDGAGSGLNADLLDGISSASFLRSDADDTMSANLTIDNGTSTTLSVKCDNAGLALIRANGDGQGSGAVEVGQANNYGGGIAYNGDGSPSFASGETDDHIMFYRLDNGTRTEVFHYPYNSNTVNFNARPTIGGVGIVKSDDTIAQATNASTLDNIDSGSFLRSDANDSFSGTITANSDATNPIIKVQGAGPNFIQFASDSSGTVDADSINLIYRTTPNTLAFERASDAQVMFSVDADNQQAIFAGNLDALNGIDVTGNITVSGTVDGVDIAARDTLFGGLTSSSGVLTNGVTATTQSAGNNTTRVATTAFVSTAISNLIDSSPSTLNTLNELASALGDDPNFATTVTNSIATKMPLAGGTFTGDVTFSGGAGAASIAADSDIRLTSGSTWSGNAVKIQNYANYLYIGLPANGIIFREAGTDRWAIDGSGHFTPKSDSTYNIGSNGVRVANGYFDTLYGSGANLTALNASNLSSGSVPAARLGTASTSEFGVSATGNFGQYEGHGTYTDFNTEPAYWGWNFVQGNTNAPNTSSSQWYRCRLSLGSSYGKGSASGDYSLEMALPRSSHSAAGVLHIRTIENGGEGSWTTVGDNASLITTGTLPAARLPNHSAALLTSGTISDARLPNSISSSITGNAATASDAALLDGLDSSQFLRSDASDVMTGNFTLDGNFTMSAGHPIIHNQTASRDKIRVWNASAYAIGMDNAMSFGGLNDYAMTFQMNSEADRGWVFLDSSHSDAQGAMSLTTQGKMALAHSLRLAYGESDTTTPGATYRLDVNGATQILGDLAIGDGSATTNRILIKKSDNNVSDHIIFYNGTTRIGEIGCEDNTWLRINQETNKNIYTPRYIRADNGFFVDGTSKGINGSGNFIGGTIAGASDYGTLVRSDADDSITGLLTITNDDGLNIYTSTNAAGAKIKFSDNTNQGQSGTLTYKHADGAVTTTGGNSNDGWLFEGTETRTVVKVVGDIEATSNIYGAGSNITALNASNISSGTLAAARLPNHSAALLTSGTIPSARLSASDLLTLIKTVDGSGSGLDADTLDNLGSGSFLRSNANDNVTAHTEWQDNYQVRLGNAADMRLYHNGTNSYIDNITGHIYIRNTSSNDDSNIYLMARNEENSIICEDDGDVRLFSNGTEVFRTDTTNSNKTKHLYPWSDSAYDLGTSSNRFRNIYADTLYGDGSNLTGISAGAQGGGSDEVFWCNGQTVTSNFTIPNGKNAMSAGPITINSGVTVTVGSGETWTVV